MLLHTGHCKLVEGSGTRARALGDQTTSTLKISRIDFGDCGALATSKRGEQQRRPGIHVRFPKNSHSGSRLSSMIPHCCLVARMCEVRTSSSGQTGVMGRKLEVELEPVCRQVVAGPRSRPTTAGATKAAVLPRHRFPVQAGLAPARGSVPNAASLPCEHPWTLLCYAHRRCAVPRDYGGHDDSLWARLVCGDQDAESRRRIDYILTRSPRLGGVGNVVRCVIEGTARVKGVVPFDHCAVVAELRY